MESDTASDHSSEPRTSPLGTKAYWDKLYARELANNNHDPQDTGTIWFDDTNAEELMIKCLATVHHHASIPIPFANHASSRILDLGTGNGHLLFRLRDEGYACEMTGVDYSEASVELCRRIAERHEHNKYSDIMFFTSDFLSKPDEENKQDWVGGGFDLILDKGTFDAISLSTSPQDADQRPCVEYVKTLHRVLKPGGLFLIVSCNFTEEELRGYFANQMKGELAVDVPDHNTMEVLDRISFPTFQFGGQTGQSVYGVCFRRRDISGADKERS